MPRLNPVVADTTRTLKSQAISKLMREIRRLQRRYPGLVLQLVLHHFPEEHPVSMHAFWLFNAGAFAGEGKRGKENLALMVVADPGRKEAAIVRGYGLEETLDEEAMAHLLNMSGPAFGSGKWELGFSVLLEGLDQLLEMKTQIQGGEGAMDDDY